MISFHTTLLLSAALALLIFNETKVSCGTVIVQSSSSGFETFCNGLRCPPGSNCMVFTGVINGNKTSDKRCSNIYGEVVRQETITTSNGKMCIKNLTMMGEKVNMQQSCRNLSKAEIEEEENNRKIQEAVQVELKQKQDEIEDAIDEKARLYDEWRLELEKAITHKTEAINKAAKMRADALERAAEATAEQLESRLAEMERQLEARLAEMDRQLKDTFG